MILVLFALIVSVVNAIVFLSVSLFVLSRLLND